MSTTAGYNVYSRTGSAPYAKVLSTTVTSATVGNLLPATKYYFVVKAYDSAGVESAASAEVNATTLSAQTLNLVITVTGTTAAPIVTVRTGP